MGKLEGKIAIVTGSGKGIGRDAALAIAAEGATVVTVARTQSDLDETVKMIEDAGGTAISLSRDLTDGEQVADMVKTVVDKYGRIDILVNNAGGYPKEIYKNIEHQAIKIWEWSEEQWDQIIKTNLRIPFLVTKNVVPVMIKQGKGDIVSVWSPEIYSVNSRSSFSNVKSPVSTFILSGMLLPPVVRKWDLTARHFLKFWDIRPSRSPWIFMCTAA